MAFSSRAVHQFLRRPIAFFAVTASLEEKLKFVHKCVWVKSFFADAILAVTRVTMLSAV